MKNLYVSQAEKGQVMVLLLLGIIGLMGFAALAIDGGMLYAERRAAQNAADAAVLAAAQQIQLGNGVNAAKTAAVNLAAANGYTVSDTSVNVTGPHLDQSGRSYHLVEVTITSNVPSSFAHFVFGDLATTVQAAGRYSFAAPPMGGYAIVALGNCLAPGGPDSLLEITGGGNSGGIRTFSGGMFLNTPETAANHCAIDPPSSSGNDGIRAMPDPDGVQRHYIHSVGSYGYAGASSISPVPIQTGANSGSVIGDPLASLPEPTCPKTCTKTNATCKSGSNYYPGAWNAGDMGPGTYNPGIYCITGELKGSGGDQYNGEGVLFYFVNSGTQFTGNSGLNLSAPTAANCTGTPGLTSSSCTYVGVVMFTKRTNTAEIDLGGNGTNRLKGTVYLPNSHINAHGGGSQPDEAMIWGQYIGQYVLNNGNGSLDVWYREDLVYRFPPTVNLEK